MGNSLETNIQKVVRRQQDVINRKRELKALDMCTDYALRQNFDLEPRSELDQWLAECSPRPLPTDTHAKWLRTVAHILSSEGYRIRRYPRKPTQNGWRSVPASGNKHTI